MELINMNPNQTNPDGQQGADGASFYYFYCYCNCYSVVGLVAALLSVVF